VVDVRIPGGIALHNEMRRRTYTKTCSGFPRVNDTDSRTLKVGYIPGRDGQTVHQGRGCDKGTTIGARIRYVKRRASLGDGGIYRKDTAGECRQHLYPGFDRVAKNATSDPYSLRQQDDARGFRRAPQLLIQRGQREPLPQGQVQVSGVVSG
jgi:hypothetical protein